MKADLRGVSSEKRNVKRCSTSGSSAVLALVLVGSAQVPIETSVAVVPMEVSWAIPCAVTGGMR